MGIIVALTAVLYVSIHTLKNSSSVRNGAAAPLLQSSPGVPSELGTPTPFPDLPKANLTKDDKEKLAKIDRAFSAPIEFYGRVIDQTGTPIEGAKVHYSAANHYFGSSSNYQGVSDRRGLFSLTGIKGAGLYVSVSKDGYQGTKQSGDGFGYGVPSGRPAPSKDEPAIFVLRKKANAEPLIVTDRDLVVPLDGQPVSVSLRAGNQAGIHNPDLEIQLWAKPENKNDRGQFDWRFRLTVPGGGLVERNDTDFAFEAPTEGYVPMKELEMAQSAVNWKPSFDQNYFARLGNGNYARIRFRITTSGEHFASVTGYLNPEPGHRNLEFDPTKQIKVK